MARIAIVLGGAALVAAPAGTRRSEFVGGRLFPADGGSLVGVRVTVATGHSLFDAIVDSTGTFVAPLTADPSDQVTIRVSSEADGRYLPTEVKLARRPSSSGVRIVLLPAEWTIAGGAYEGQRIRIDPRRGVARSAEGSGFWRLAHRTRYSPGPIGWPADSLPLRVAFRRERGDGAISDRDSVAFWQLATSLEQLVGRPLFRPTMAAEIDGGADGILVAVNPRMSAVGRTFITYDAGGRIYDALVTVQGRSLLGDSHVTMHELLHALGFGHTSSWSSIMGSRHDARVASPEDVAYAQLLYRVAAIQRANAAPYGIPEAVAAARARAFARGE